MKTRTFAELEADPNVTAAELKAVLEEYATIGAGINSEVVVKLINRTTLSEGDRIALIESARKGEDLKTAVRDNKCAKEYNAVIKHLSL